MASSSNKSAAKAKILGRREPEDDLKTKPILKKHKAISEEKETTTEGFVDSRVELSETKSDQANLISEKETAEELDDPPHFVEEVAATRKNTLIAHNLSPQTNISDVIDFFHNVEGVVRITLITNHKGEHAGYGLVEFASASEAKKAMEKKNGEYLHYHKIYVDVATATNPPRSKYCIDHKVVWYEDYLRRKNIFIEENETVEGHDEDAGSVEEVAIRKKTLFVADLSPQTEIFDVCNFFHDVGQVVSLRLIVNHKGEHVGCGFVEFASAYEAEKAVKKKKGKYLHDHKIFLDVAKIAPYPPRPKYEDYHRQESLLIEEDETAQRVDEDPDFVEEAATEEKTLIVGHFSPQTKILDICKFFRFVRGVVHVQLNVDDKGNHAGCGFVEFASANEAKKALEEKNGECLRNCMIILDVAKRDIYPPLPKYEDYLRQESLRIEKEDETMEGLVQEVAIRKKTLFLGNLPPQSGMRDIWKYFGESTIWGIVGQGLIVNHEGEHVGCGFVEFDSTYEAGNALRMVKGKYLHNHKIHLDRAKRATYPPQAKYNLAEKLWNDEYLRLRAKPFVKFCGRKTTFVDEEEKLGV